MKQTIYGLMLAGGFCASLSFAQTTAPGLLSIGPEELVSTLFMERPAISTDSQCQPHLVCDNGGKTQFMKFHKVNGSWSGGVFAVGSQGGRYDASRLYVGQIEIDSRDRAWISCKFGVKEYGRMYGQGIWLFRDVAAKPNPPEQFFRFVCVYKGMGLVTTDAKHPDQGIVIGTFGNFAVLDAAGRTLKTGSLNGGPGGEKVRARVASFAPRFGALPGKTYADGIWHTAMNGYSASSSKYQNSARYKAGLGPVDWAAYSAYPQQGSDFSHPGFGIDLVNPAIAYMGSVFNGKLCVNIWNGARMLFSTSNLKVLDYSASYEIRHGPAFTPAPAGGAFVFWTSHNRLKMCWLSPKGAPGPITDIGFGRSPAAATDRAGNLHLVYSANGIRYRKIRVASLDPLEPQGYIAATRTPRFRWSDSQAATYTLELTRDGQPLLSATTAACDWAPPSDLPVGAYSWRVREGDADTAKPWSRTLTFVIPPDWPEPIAPAGRISRHPMAPEFEWMCDDPDANRFKIQLGTETNSLGILTVYGAGKPPAASWRAVLPAGRYQWRIKSLRALTGYTVGGEWSPWTAFQIAVPGACAFTEPAPLASRYPGKQTISCAWTPAAGARSYTLTALFNGVPVASASALTTTNFPFTRAFEPGYYSLIVQPVNGAGTGPVSPVRTFLVRRNMTPATGSRFTAPPGVFSWTRSRKAGQYLLKLARYDETRKRYTVIGEHWIAQPVKGLPSWNAGKLHAAGRYRWAITDFTGSRQGYTSTARFEIQDLASPAP